MKKITLLLAILVCLLDISVVLGNNGSTEEKSNSGRSKLKSSGRSAKLGNTDNGNQESSGKALKADKSLSSSDISKIKEAVRRIGSGRSISNEETELESEESDDNNGLATLPNGPAYVGVNSSLCLRDGVWGEVIDDLYNNEKVTITGRDGDWYTVSTDKGNGYVYAKYIFGAPNSKNKIIPEDSTGSKVSGLKNKEISSSNKSVLNVSGNSLQGKIVSAAEQLVEDYPGYQSFPYADETDGGDNGCAQVATTALCAAGALSATRSSDGLGYASLLVDETVDLLKEAGWVTVEAPPYQAGDVVAWEDYGHIGIIMTSGDTAEAMHNSSSQRKPTYIDVEYFEVTEVIRKS